MSYRVKQAVQLIGHTVYEPPLDPNVEEMSFVLEPHDDATDGENLIEFAGRGCYESWSRPTPATAKIDGYLRNIFTSQHFSVIEHATASIWITGISRSCSHEVVRHRHMSFSQLSQRFVNESTLKIVVPPAIEEYYEYDNDIDGLEEWAERLGRQAILDYEVEVNRLTERDPDKTRKQVRETARAVLPNATETRMVLSGNYRSWLEFLLKRDSPHADAEIARLARNIRPLLIELAPNIFGAKPMQIIRAALSQ